MAWYEEWFDSKYYHILYKNRDNKEANLFIDNLFNFLNLKANSFVLDAACGKGRHALLVNNKGFRVDAFDLSPNSIALVKNLENDRLKFYVNDVRKPLFLAKYDLILNLFTSIGYFDSEEDYNQLFKAFSKSLKPRASIVIDFMNANKVKKDIVIGEEKTIERTVEGIKFLITKKMQNEKILKKIFFKDGGKKFSYQEEVTCLSLKQFESYLQTVGIVITAIFGDYNLSSFDTNKSPRLIIIAQKR